MPGRELLQLPGPTNVPDAVLHALARRTIDHRGDEFRELTGRILARLPLVFGATDPVVIFPASASGAWEAALANTLSPGDEVLAFDNGHFAVLWAELARKLGLEVRLVPGDWRRAVDPDVLAAELARDTGRRIRAILVVHNETSTGVTSDVGALRAAIDEVGHPALLMVDAVSSAGALPYAHDRWGVDVTVTGSQKGLLLPPGMSFNVAGRRALAAARDARLPRGYWDWGPILAANEDGTFPYTPPTNLLFGLDAALDLLLDEGLDAVYARHARFGRATRAAVEAWGLELVAAEPRERSDSLTACFVPTGVSESDLHRVMRTRLGVVVGRGLGRFAGSTMRIGHLGDLNAATLLGALAGIEAAFHVCGHQSASSGIARATSVLAQELSAAGSPGSSDAIATTGGVPAWEAGEQQEVLTR